MNKRSHQLFKQHYLFESIIHMARSRRRRHFRNTSLRPNPLRNWYMVKPIGHCILLARYLHFPTPFIDNWLFAMGKPLENGKQVHKIASNINVYIFNFLNVICRQINFLLSVTLESLFFRSQRLIRPNQINHVWNVRVLFFVCAHWNIYIANLMPSPLFETSAKFH